MGKTKMIEDPGDPERLKVQGAMPESEILTADSPLSNERVGTDGLERIVSGDLVTRTTARTDDFGVQRITAVQVRIPDAPVHRRFGRMPMPGDKEREAEAATLQLRIEAEQAKIVPSVSYFGSALVCSNFVSRGGDGQVIGQPDWCRREPCPSWSGKGVCAAKMLSTAKMLIRTIQPETWDAYNTMVVEEGAERGADYEGRLKEAKRQVDAAHAAEKKAQHEVVIARDQEIMRLRREKCLQPQITVLTPESAVLRSKAAYDGMRGR